MFIYNHSENRFYPNLFAFYDLGCLIRKFVPHEYVSSDSWYYSSLDYVPVVGYHVPIQLLYQDLFKLHELSDL